MEYNNNDYSYCNVVGQTDIGRKRKANEDHGGHFVTVNGLVSVVCDGMGGHVGGAVASEIAVNTIHEFLDSQFFDDPREAIGLAVDAANEAIIRRANQEPELSGMGSTCVLLIVRGGRVYIGHVGDSRIYLVREKKIVQLTKDHSFVQSLVDIGEITQEEAEHHPRKNEITNALGIPNMSPATVRNESIEPQAGDCFVLCSDGLSGMVDSHSMERIVSRQREYSTQQRADLLVQAANNNGGVDNITVELVEFSVTPELEPDGKGGALRNKKLIPAIVCGCLAVAALLFFLLRPTTKENVYKILDDVEYTADKSVYELFVDQKSGVTSILNLESGKAEKIEDESIGIMIKTNLVEKELEQGKYQLSFASDFKDDSLVISFSSKKKEYRYAAAVVRNTRPQSSTLPEIFFRPNLPFATILKDLESIKIDIVNSETPISANGAIENVQVQPQECIVQSNDYKIVLGFPKKYSFDEVTVSYDCDGVTYKYVIPIANASSLLENGPAINNLAPGKPIVVDEPKTIKDSVVRDEPKHDEASQENISYGLAVRVDCSKPFLVIKDTKGFPFVAGEIRGSLKQLDEINEAGITVSPSSVDWTFDNDQYVFNAPDYKSGNKYVVNIPGKDKIGKDVKVIITITIE